MKTMNAKPNTLVIDGDSLSPLVSSRCRKKNGVHAYRARDRESGLAQLRRNSVDAVIANENHFNIVQESGVMKKICSLIADLAKTDSTVLIQGETGTGKEMIAKAIHHNSCRRDRPMIGFSCAALSATLIESELFGHEKGAFTGALKTRAGRFEQADGGTLFLDEVGEMPLELQVKLLRALQEKQFERVGGNETVKVDVRIITATNRDLRRAVREGKFREDLFYRLNVVFIQAPPLRERLEDVPPLAFHFLQECTRRSNKEIDDIEKDAVQLLLTQPWPGNIRELQNVIERSVLMEKGRVLTRTTIASCLNAGTPPHESVALFREDLPYHQAKDELLDRFDRAYIATLLNIHGGNITRAACAARLGYRNFYEKMKRLGITKWEFKKD